MKRLTMVIFLMAIFFLWNIPIVAAQFKEAGVQKFNSPVEAPDFTLRELDGGMISSKELRGKIIILNFFTVG
jgi:cytochrome oxidase Cu insertion factor (SCO1/SenC/PrrC family)